MSQETQPQQADQPSQIDPSPEATVVEWGGDEKRNRRRLPLVGRFVGGDRLPRLAGDLAGDRRLVPLAVALGGVALFVSLISEWQVTSVDGTLFGDTEVGNRPIEAGIVDLGGWGGGYLAGLFLLVGATVVLLFGPPAGRVYGRLAALSTGGVLLAILVALLSELGEDSRFTSMMGLALDDDQFEVTYGRGLWCALAGVTAVTLGAYLAGRHLPAVPVATTGATAVRGDGETADGETADDVPADWPWRRPHADGRDAEDRPDAPLGLTVSSTTPFTPLGERKLGERKLGEGRDRG